MKSFAIMLSVVCLTACVSQKEGIDLVTKKILGPENSVLSYFLTKTELDEQHQKMILTDVNTALTNENDKNFNIVNELNSCISNVNSASLFKKDWKDIHLSNQSTTKEVISLFKSEICQS